MDALRASLPAGTLSGAPKIRAMQIIDELEPVKRGPYGGAVGYLSYTGELDTCIYIRSALVKDGARARAGRRRASWPTRTPTTRCARPRRRPTRCSRRSGWRASRGTGRDPRARDRQLRLVHLQPRPVPGRAGGRARGGAQRRAGRGRAAGARRPTALVVSPGPCTPAEAGVSVDAIRALRRGGRARARRVPRPPGAGHGVRREGRARRSRCTARPRAWSTTAGRSSPVSNPRSWPGATTRWSWTRTCPTASSARRFAGDVVMAIRHRELPAEGVQFHPESVLTEHGKALLRNFLG